MTTRIIGTGCYIPEQVLSNDDLSKMVDTSDEWISSRTGIRRRHISTEGTSSMAAVAAERACMDAGIDPEEIDLIILATSSADNYFPNGASEIQKAIGASRAAAFDLSAACTGFVYAFNTMHAFLQAGIYQTGLVVGAESMSRLLDWNDRSTCVLFGDGAGAVVVKRSEIGVVSLEMSADGTKCNALTCESRFMENPFQEEATDAYIKMDGQEVFKFALKRVPESVKEVLKQGNLEPQDVKYYILHQANQRIIQSVAKRLGEPIDKFPMNLMEYGNTSAASIPIMLDELNKEGKFAKGDYLVMSGFGAGLTWGSTLLAW